MGRTSRPVGWLTSRAAQNMRAGCSIEMEDEEAGYRFGAHVFTPGEYGSEVRMANCTLSGSLGSSP
jgi:hypothetical protein